MGTVVVLGSLITDLVARAPRLPHAGESLLGDGFATFLGGKGINQAIAAARLGAHVTLIGRVGTDSFGDAFFPILEHEGIDSTYVSRDTNVGTGVSSLIIATESGQNVIVVNPLANFAVTAESVEAALSAVQEQLAQRGEPIQEAMFLTQCETSTVSYTTGLQLAHKLGMRTVLNAAPIPREGLPVNLLELVDILIVNETEATYLSQVAVHSPETAQVAAAQLLTRGPQHVIITLGAQGCLWCTAAEQKTISPIVVKAVDATAAGDAFCGALAASLTSDRDMLTALQHANAAGAVAATRMGAIASLPTLDDIEMLLRDK